MSARSKPLLAFFVLQVVVSLASPSLAWSADRDYWPTKEWRTSSPEQQGMDPALVGRISAYAKESLPTLQSLIVVRHGYIVFEEYFEGGRDDLRQLRSCTKSVISSLVGVALKQGLLQGNDQKWIEFFPEVAGVDPRKRVDKISIHHLLTHTSGIDFELTNWKKLADRFSQSNIGEPGTGFVYKDANYNILSMVITRVSDMKASDYAKKYLFEPLGIDSYKWESMWGYSTGGDGLYLRSRDLAKIGYCYLNQGRWDQEQIVAPEWVAQSTRAVVPSTGGTYKYGYGWWVCQLKTHPLFCAIGVHGQQMYVMPDLDVVVTATAYAPAVYVSYDNLLEQYVIPAVQD